MASGLLWANCMTVVSDQKTVVPVKNSENLMESERQKGGQTTGSDSCFLCRYVGVVLDYIDSLIVSISR